MLKRTLRVSILSVAMLNGVALGYPQSELGYDIPDHSKITWAVVEPHGLPGYEWYKASPLNSISNAFYKELYPINLVKIGLGAVPQRLPEYLSRSGFNGEVILQNPSNSGDLGKALDEAEASRLDMRVALGVEGCNSATDAVRLIETYVRSSYKHASAATILDHGKRKWVVFNYWIRSLPATGENSWASVLDQLHRMGIEVYFVADTGPIPWIFERRDLEPYMSVVQAFYTFGYPYHGYTWNDVFKVMNDHHLPFVGGVMPGAARETSANAGFEDAAGTQFFRNAWESMLAGMSKLSGRWMTGVTWNDTVERTEIRPTSNWNWTRADLNDFYSAHFRGIANPTSVPKLYVTTPQEVHLGEKSVVESLVINWSKSSIESEIQLQDDQHSNIGNPVYALIKANSVGAAKLPIRIESLPHGRFLRAVASMRSSDGRLMKTVQSAPILVYEPSECMRLKMLYYSIPADRALPAIVKLSMVGNPVTSKSATATVTPPDASFVRFVEVLQNTRQVAISFDAKPFTCSIPQAYAPTADSFAAPGFYVGRVIDEFERVGYSDPIYVSRDDK